LEHTWTRPARLGEGTALLYEDAQTRVFCTRLGLMVWAEIQPDGSLRKRAVMLAARAVAVR
jgi:hypothetical protein